MWGHLITLCFQSDTWTIIATVGRFCTHRGCGAAQQLRVLRMGTLARHGFQLAWAAPEAPWPEGIQVCPVPWEGVKPACGTSGNQALGSLFIARNHGLLIVWRASNAQNYCADRGVLCVDFNGNKSILKWSWNQCKSARNVWKYFVEIMPCSFLYFDRGSWLKWIYTNTQEISEWHLEVFPGVLFSLSATWPPW